MKRNTKRNTTKHSLTKRIHLTKKRAPPPPPPSKKMDFEITETEYDGKGAVYPKITVASKWRYPKVIQGLKLRDLNDYKYLKYTSQDFNHCHHRFLLFSHGDALTAQNVRLPINIKPFCSVSYHTDENKFMMVPMYHGFQNKYIKKNYVNFMANNPRLTIYPKNFSRLTLGKFPLRNSTEEQVFELPPLSFSYSTVEKPAMEAVFGLWYFNYENESDIQARHLLTMKDMIELFPQKYDKLTYAVILKLVQDVIKKMGIPTDVNTNIGLNFACCRASIGKFDTEIVNIPPQPARLIDRFYTAELLAAAPRGARFYPNLIRNTDIQWSRENLQEKVKIFWGDGLSTGLWFQSCGLNVLSFYNFMERAFARNASLCLPVKDTSIFRLVEHINETSSALGGFIVMRYSMRQLYDFLNGISQHNDSIYRAIVVRFYKDVYREGGVVSAGFSHFGHTTSFYFTYSVETGKRVIFYIDPQQQLFYEPFDAAGNVSPDFESFVTSNGWQYFDLTFQELSNESSTLFRTAEQFIEEIHMNTAAVIPYTPDINYGGRGRGRVGGGGSKKLSASPTGVADLELSPVAVVAAAAQPPPSVKMVEFNPKRVIRFESNFQYLPDDVFEERYTEFMKFIRANQSTAVSRSKRRSSGTRRRKTARRDTI